MPNLLSVLLLCARTLKQVVGHSILASSASSAPSARCFAHFLCFACALKQVVGRSPSLEQLELHSASPAVAAWPGANDNDTAGGGGGGNNNPPPAMVAAAGVPCADVRSPVRGVVLL